MCHVPFVIMSTVFALILLLMSCVLPHSGPKNSVGPSRICYMYILSIISQVCVIPFLNLSVNMYIFYVWLKCFCSVCPVFQFNFFNPPNLRHVHTTITNKVLFGYTAEVCLSCNLERVKALLYCARPKIIPFEELVAIMTSM